MKIIKFFAKTEILCLNLLLFIIVLIIGTVSQREIGIESVQDIYFSSKIFYINNFIPFPGCATIFFITFINILIKIVIDKYTVNKIGSFFIHFSIILFIIGALLTHKFSIEGTMIIPEKANIGYFINKHDYEINLINENFNCLKIVKNEKIDYLNKIQLNNNLSIKVKKFYKNCDIKINKNAYNFYTIKNIYSFVENENDKAALLVDIFFKNETKEIYLIEDITYIVNEDTKIEFVKAKENLPFSIELIEFNKKVYEKTSMSKSYKSIIKINYNKDSWKTNIKMNNPFRFKGYTFYQTSFIENEKQKTTILSVVKNPGTIFFYLGTLIIFIGFLIHLVIKILK